MHHFKINLNTR